MDKAELMKDEIEEQRKLPEEIINKLNFETFVNVIISIALMIYFGAINILYLIKGTAFLETDIKIFAMVLVCVDVIVFEIAYRKDSISFWIHGLELLVCGVLVLVIPYTYTYMDEQVKSIVMLVPIFLSVYYLVKSLVLHIKETKKYQNNLSDVKEIIKDEVAGYLDEINEEGKENDD